LTKSIQNRTVSYTHTIIPNNISAFLFSIQNTDPGFYFHANLSAPGHVLVISSAYFEDLVEGKPLKYGLRSEDYYVTEAEHTINDVSSTSYLIVVNPSSKNITVNVEGWISSTEFDLDESEAMKVCTRQCTMSTKESSIIYLRLKEGGAPVPVTLLDEYELDVDVSVFIIIFPVILGMLLIGLFVLSIVWCLVPKVPPPLPETPMNAMGTPANPPAMTAGLGPEATPGYDAGLPPPAPQPAVPYPGQSQNVDVYGIPV